jgi:hypothetical protein
MQNPQDGQLRLRGNNAGNVDKDDSEAGVLARTQCKSEGMDFQ